MVRTLPREGQHLLGAHTALTLVFATVICKRISVLCFKCEVAFCEDIWVIWTDLKEYWTQAEQAPLPSSGLYEARKHHWGERQQQLLITYLICARK